jgi:hypothetical protein
MRDLNKLAANITLPEENPAYVIQVVLSRQSTSSWYSINISYWTWFNHLNHTGGDTLVHICPHCMGPVNEWVCCNCYVLHDPETKWDHVTVQGSIDDVSETLADMFEHLKFDADILLLFFKKKLRQEDFFGVSTMPLDDLLEHSEHRLYTRNDLSKDNANGMKLKDCLGAFIRA